MFVNFLFRNVSKVLCVMHNIVLPAHREAGLVSDNRLTVKWLRGATRNVTPGTRTPDYGTHHDARRGSRSDVFNAEQKIRWRNVHQLESSVSGADSGCY